ncbi:MAG TPA: MlaD family protein [Stellaceae bacterium]|nr:MlaD family protein [Stellaceae bacterium]
MSDTSERRSAALPRRSRWPGWIWAVPLAALGIVVWLGVRSFIARGPEIDVSFESSAGIRAGITEVRYKGIAVGKVEDVELSPDLGHVTATLRMDSSVEKHLNRGTRFWIVGASFSPADFAALKTIIAGPYIEMDPGSGPPTRHFAGLMHPPAVPNSAAGTRFTLEAEGSATAEAGSPISYLGLRVGTVEARRLLKDGKGFELDAFIAAPYDKLVHAGTRFWNAGGVALQVTGQGFEAKLPSLGALLSGAIAFATPEAAAATPLGRAGERFPLYPDKRAAEDAPSGPRLPYLVAFGGAVGDLALGAPVKLRGFRIGEVSAVSLVFDSKSGALETPAVIEIEPDRLGLAGTAPPSDGSWRPVLDRALSEMIANGLRARLDRDPPLIGGRIVTLAFVPDAPPAALATGGRYPEIPAVPSGDIGALTASAGEIARRIAGLPLPEIAQGLHDIVGRLDRLAASPAVTASLQHLDRTLASLDHVTHEANGKIGPLIASLRRTADAAQSAAAAANNLMGGGFAEQNRDLPAALHELATAARSVRSLANYLDRHPEALLQGKPDSSQ